MNRKKRQAVTSRPLARNVKECPTTGFATVDEGAAFLSISRRKYQRACKSGDIPARRFGIEWRTPWAWLRKEEIQEETQEEIKVA